MRELAVGLLVFIFSFSVFAQAPTESLRERVQEKVRESQEDIRPLRKSRNSEIELRRDALKTELRNIRENRGNKAANEEIRNRIRSFLKDAAGIRGRAKEAIEARRENLKILLEEQRLEFRKMIQAKRKELRDSIRAKREELRARLQEIRDKRKAEIMERIYDRLNALNERLTNHFMSALEKMESVLININSRADKAEANGRDVSAVRAAIETAHRAINDARTAVEEQAGKTYSIDVTDENSLRVDAGAARQALRDDLAAVRAAVKSAHDAVRNAATTLARIPRVDDLDIPENNEDASTSTNE